MTIDPDRDFSAFVQSRSPSLLRAAFLLTGDRHLAEDLVQAALARTHLHWRRLHDPANAEAYTRKAMYHRQVSIWRRRRPTESLAGPVPDVADPDDLTARVDTRLAVRAALSRLTPRQRAVLVLRFFDDRSEAETAEILQVSRGTVKSQTSYALNRMRELAPELAGLAGEMPISDVEPGVRRRGQSLRRRRATSAVVAVVAVVLAIAAGVVGLRPRPVVPPVAPTPTASPSRGPGLPPPVGATAAFTCPGVAGQGRPAAATPDTLFFWTWDDAHACAVLSRLGGGRTQVLATVPYGQGYGPVQTVALSPDGTRLAWITNDDSSAQAGDLAIAEIGGAARLLGGGAFYANGGSPNWEPDSRHLLVLEKDGGAFRVDVTTGVAQETTLDGGPRTYSANGAFVSYVEGLNRLVVRRSDGTPVSDIAYAGPDPQCGCRFSVQGVSDDGRLVVVGRGSTDPSRVMGGFVVLDAATGAARPLPVTAPPGRSISQVVLRPGGGLLVVVTGPDGATPRASFVSATGVVTNQVDLPGLGTVVRIAD